MTIKFGQCQLYATPFNFFSLADRPDVKNNKSLHDIVPRLYLACTAGSSTMLHYLF